MAKPNSSEQSGAKGQGLAYGVYEAVVAYLIRTGWRRQELGSGWWWKDGCAEEATTGRAFEQQLDADGIDQREAIFGEPEEFWG